MTRFTLGINMGFATNRFPEPAVWAQLVSEEMGLHAVQLVADLLNPFWPAHAAKILGADPEFKRMPVQYGWWLDRRRKTGYEG